ncbi:MAG: hypothetical protein KAS90_01575 [Candidatus Aenigmarchaeota archaeon]|nr:hypothetical protein [Candidatus Aenigmarchaeota archaeon]
MSWEQPLLVGNNYQPVEFYTGGKKHKGKINIHNYINYPEKGVIIKWREAGFSITRMTTDPENEEAVSLTFTNSYLIDPVHLEDNKKFGDYDTKTRKKITIKDSEDIAEIYPVIRNKNPFVDENGFLKSTTPSQYWNLKPKDDCIEKTFEKLSFSDMTQIFVNMYERQIFVACHLSLALPFLAESKHPYDGRVLDEFEIEELKMSSPDEDRHLKKIIDENNNLTLKTLTYLEGIPKVMKDYIEKHADEIEESYLYQTMIARNREDIDILIKRTEQYNKIPIQDGLENLDKIITSP